ncbi:MAG: DUF4332 domain-containing protein [Candidatus Sericytochromatia bacterium]|nr:DUF4332 domain-containing protein [Candidatus Sericytochromatia bacterium]
MKAQLLSALGAAILLSACSSGQVSPIAPQTLADSAPLALLTPTEISPAPIALQPVSAELVSQSAAPRPQRVSLPKTPAAPQSAPAQTQARSSQTEAESILGYSAAELARIEALIAQLAPQIAAEDAAADLGGFRLQSAEAGKDVDIELFLFDARYGKKAKFWGIDNAHDFLMAGRSPMRRWLLKLKLEGLFSPARFAEQVLFWVQQADLLRVPGIDREQAWLLAAAGVTSTPDLARRTNAVGQTALLLSLKTMALAHGLPLPSASQLETWVSQAQQLEPIIY